MSPRNSAAEAARINTRTVLAARRSLAAFNAGVDDTTGIGSD